MLVPKTCQLFGVPPDKDGIIQTGHDLDNEGLYVK